MTRHDHPPAIANFAFKLLGVLFVVFLLFYMYYVFGRRKSLMRTLIAPTDSADREQQRGQLSEVQEAPENEA